MINDADGETNYERKQSVCERNLQRCSVGGGWKKLMLSVKKNYVFFYFHNWPKLLQLYLY